MRKTFRIKRLERERAARDVANANAVFFVVTMLVSACLSVPLGMMLHALSLTAGGLIH